MTSADIKTGVKQEIKEMVAESYNFSQILSVKNTGKEKGGFYLAAEIC